ADELAVGRKQNQAGQRSPSAADPLVVGESPQGQRLVFLADGEDDPAVRAEDAGPDRSLVDEDGLERMDVFEPAGHRRANRSPQRWVLFGDLLKGAGQPEQSVGGISAAG